MNPNKALWEKGDFTEIAAFMRQSGEAVVKSLGITTPLRVWTLGAEMALRRFLSPFWGLKLSESTLPGTSLTPGTNELRRPASTG